MKTRTVLVAAAFVAWFAPPALAQQATFHDALLDRLAGRWVLKGTIDKGKTTHDVSATWVLAHQYLELREISREKNKDGSPFYQATVYIGWDAKLRQYVCVWLDDYGSISTQSLGHAPRAGDAIAFVFQDRDDSGTFHTTFTWHKADSSWTMDMDQETGGRLSPFARTVLTRVK